LIRPYLQFERTSRGHIRIREVTLNSALASFNFNALQTFILTGGARVSLNALYLTDSSSSPHENITAYGAIVEDNPVSLIDQTDDGSEDHIVLAVVQGEVEPPEVS